MRFPNHLLLIALAGFFGAAPAIAQEAHEHRDPEPAVGQVYFPISCSPDAQRRFNRAVAWLHSFEYDRAGQEFAAISETDPDCAMAYWGAAQSSYHPLWAPPGPAELKAGLAATEKAASIRARTRRENDYIAAIAVFYKDYDKLDYHRRALAYEQAMERVRRRYPQDREAAVFYALSLNATALATVPADKSYLKQKKAAAILNAVLREQPRHPGVAHYLIHSYDYPQLAALALPAARSYARIAPGSAHALHMPSHIFTRLGLWRESIKSNLASEAAAKSHAAEARMTGAWDEQLHAMDYLTYAYLQGSQDKKAAHVLDEIQGIRRAEPENFKVAYAFAAVPARYALERRDWTAAAHLTERADFPWDRFPYASAITNFARAIGSARTGDTAAAHKDVEALAAIQKGLVGAKDNYDWSVQVEIQRRAAAAWLAHAEGNDAEALRLMREAADLEDSTEKHPVTPGPVLPARELLGDLLLEAKQPSEALKQFETSLVNSPNRNYGLYGAARAAELCGNRAAAARYRREIKRLCRFADTDRADLQQLSYRVLSEPPARSRQRVKCIGHDSKKAATKGRIESGASLSL